MQAWWVQEAESTCITDDMWQQCRTVGAAAAAALHKVPLVPDLAIAPPLNPSVGV